MYIGTALSVWRIKILMGYRSNSTINFNGIDESTAKRTAGSFESIVRHLCTLLRFRHATKFETYSIAHMQNKNDRRRPLA